MVIRSRSEFRCRLGLSRWIVGNNNVFSWYNRLGGIGHEIVIRQTKRVELWF